MLAQCCRNADVDGVQKCLTNGHCPNAEDTRGVTPLMAAVGVQGGIEVVKRLLIHGADTSLGCAPLCFFIVDDDLRRWLNERHDYISKCHFFEDFPVDLLVKTLHDGSFMLSHRSRLGRSPFELAESSDSGNASIIHLAAQAFSPENASLWPGFARRRALDLLVVFEDIFAVFGRALRDPFLNEVLPRCIGERAVIEKWRRAILCSMFLVKLMRRARVRVKSRSAEGALKER